MLRSWADPSLHLYGPLSCGGLLGITRFQGKGGGSPPTPACTRFSKPPLPSPSHCAESLLYPALVILGWGKAEHYHPPSLVPGQLLDYRRCLPLGCRTGILLLRPYPQPDKPGTCWPKLWAGAPSCGPGGTGHLCQLLRCTGSAGDLGLGPMRGSAGVSHPFPISSWVLCHGCHAVCALVPVPCSLWCAVHHCAMPSVPCHAMYAVHLCCVIHAGLSVLCYPCHTISLVLGLMHANALCAGHLHCAVHARPCWLCHAGCAMPSLLCWLHLSSQEKVLELARPQLALVPLGYSMSLLLWNPHGPGTQLPFQSIVWQVRAQGMAGER